MAANPTTTEILTIPIANIEPEPSTSKDTPAPRLEDQRGTRLYVGNLDHSVDEYALLQVFSTFGHVAKLDFLYHTSGPLKGKPRGYAFVEFATKQEATKALVACHDKPLRRRRITVTFASQNTHAVYNSGVGPHRRHAAPPKHTTLSLMKTQNKPQSTSAKIAALEAKLGVLERDRTSKEADALLTEVLGPASAISSLPAKPPPSIVPASDANGVQSVPRRSRPELVTAKSGPLLNLGVVPPSIKDAASRPPVLSAQGKERPGKAALQASLGIVRKK
ncbi:unnamed protein product [Rhizoctonia solani]|uniref:RRM domain-containing protein n=1 Tax=Rhizoctonia solani TaxID=456999 RepID=A0A8H3HN26_9AGAM|nr:unnamed protein product [Rhizoctonia solani]